MTNEEAIRLLRQEIKYAPQPIAEACAVAVEALEKQIPKKPIEEWISMKFLESIGCKSLHKMCPSCKEIEVCKMDRYCPQCGQEIDWSDSE